jgi:protein TonB
MPEYPGGKEAMTQWLAENIKYPPAAKKDNIIGLVTVSAVVEKNGSLSDVKVKKDIGGNCGAEAVRAVKTMPTWIPGQVKNEDKRVRVTINVFLSSLTERGTSTDTRSTIDDARSTMHYARKHNTRCA